MEQTVVETTSLAPPMCRLVLGTAACADGPSIAAARMEACVEPTPRYALMIGLPLAVVVDGQVLSAPVVQKPIRGGRTMVSGAFTEQQGHGSRGKR